jgi:NH3-dependent NAD+ synthetase
MKLCGFINKYSGDANFRVAVYNSFNKTKVWSLRKYRRSKNNLENHRRNEKR